MGALQALPRRPLGTLTFTADDRIIQFDVSQRSWPDEALVTDEAQATLLGGDESMVLIRDGSWRWVAVKQFRLPTGSPQSATDALNTLLSNPSYRDNYLGGGGIHPHMHGPYRLEAISIESFRTCDGTTATTTIEDWLHEDGHVSEEHIEGSLADVYRLIEEADTWPHLADLGETAYHDFGFILDKPFIEFVLIGPKDRLAVICRKWRLRTRGGRTGGLGFSTDVGHRPTFGDTSSHLDRSFVAEDRIRAWRTRRLPRRRRRPLPCGRWDASATRRQHSRRMSPLAHPRRAPARRRVGQLAGRPARSRQE